MEPIIDREYDKKIDSIILASKITEKQKIMKFDEIEDELCIIHYDDELKMITDIFPFYSYGMKEISHYSIAITKDNRFLLCNWFTPYMVLIQKENNKYEAESMYEPMDILFKKWILKF